MPPILNGQSLRKAYGATPLFDNISFTVSEGDRIGVVGPNGSGKSTLLEILAGRIDTDAGEVSRRKLARVGYIAQSSDFGPGDTIRSVLYQALVRIGAPESEREARLAETLGRAGFEDFNVPAAALSGGWRKRLAIAEALVQRPDVLLLDEPTNHLDLAGIEWLEKLLLTASFAYVVVSHDRYFLENIAHTMVELNRMYAEGFLRVQGNYSEFLEKKDEYLQAQTKRQDALANRVRTEIDWLRRGPKARTTKSKARIDSANSMIGDLADMRSRSRTATVGIDFSATDRQTKRLVELEGVCCKMGEQVLFDKLDFILTAGMRLGLVGPNGSGKTTLLRLLRGEQLPDSGEIRSAPTLRIVYFDQDRQLDNNMTLRRALAPDSDSVIYQGRVQHVASWAERFLFTSEQLNQPVERLSGGERARVLIAKLMLQPADLLLLDEPTNDLDIPTLEILEEGLLEFRGALVLVTHDRFMLDRVSTTVLGLDGRGGAERFADYSQWNAWKNERGQKKNTELTPRSANNNGAEKSAAATPSGQIKKKLSYIEGREYATIEQDIAAAEQQLEQRREALESPTIASDAAALESAAAAVRAAEDAVDALYLRWTELEAKLK
ncbi:MAG: ABC-F family ATP-binding cassette domain-containing protein [Acidobacteriaceae bacterium]